jgi:hypothetical protein
MSDRITLANLRAVMSRMCRAMDIPEGPVWTRDEQGNNRARIGALILEQGSSTYGNAWKICQMCNEGGGERVLLRGSTARELWDAAQAWLAGYDAAHARRITLDKALGGYRLWIDGTVVETFTDATLPEYLKPATR